MSVLSYLQLPEASYVPKYATLDKTLLNTVDTQIEGQIQQGKQSLSTFDQLADTTGKSLSVLPESYQRQYNEALNQAKAQLDTDVEKYGYRNIQGRVSNIARDFQNQVNPLLQTAGQVSAAYKRIDESDADGMSKQAGRIAINQALESGEGYKAPEYIAAFENWRDLRKDINDLASGWQAGARRAFGYLQWGLY
jgi:virulence-associated protein VapD